MNTIEGSNRQLMKVTKSKTAFPSNESLQKKMLYLAMVDINEYGLTLTGLGTDPIQ